MESKGLAEDDTLLTVCYYDNLMYEYLGTGTHRNNYSVSPQG